MNAVKEQKKATIKDIARELNTTAATVSRALNNNPRISKKTKLAVLDAAARLNYQPNTLAAALRNGKSKIIGMVVPTIDRSFFASVVRGFEEIAIQANYRVMICQSYDDYDKEVMAIDALINAQVDGIVISFAKATRQFDHLERVQKKGIPLILFDRTTTELKANQVVIDDFEGAYQTVAHLIQQGCTRIACFTSTVPLSIYNERYRGYVEALERHGIPLDSTLVVGSNLQLEDGRVAMEKMLQLAAPPDAVFAASDYCAMGAMQVLNERGISIPEKVAVAGFSNEPFTSFSDPSLTSVDQHSIAIGNIAAEIFFELMANEKAYDKLQTICLKPTLVIRRSSLKKGL